MKGPVEGGVSKKKTSTEVAIFRRVWCWQDVLRRSAVRVDPLREGCFCASSNPRSRCSERRKWRIVLNFCGSEFELSHMQFVGLELFWCHFYMICFGYSIQSVFGIEFHVILHKLQIMSNPTTWLESLVNHSMVALWMEPGSDRPVICLWHLGG